jgi:hypothetical protein
VQGREAGFGGGIRERGLAVGELGEGRHGEARVHDSRRFFARRRESEAHGLTTARKHLKMRCQPGFSKRR